MSVWMERLVFQNIQHKKNWLRLFPPWWPKSLNRNKKQQCGASMPLLDFAPNEANKTKYGITSCAHFWHAEWLCSQGNAQDAEWLPGHRIQAEHKVIGMLWRITLSFFYSHSKFRCFRWRCGFLLSLNSSKTFPDATDWLSRLMQAVQKLWIL